MGEKTYNKKPREAWLPFLLQGLTDFNTTRKAGHGQQFPQVHSPKNERTLGEPVAGSDLSAQTNVCETTKLKVTLVATTWNLSSSLSWRGFRR